MLHAEQEYVYGHPLYVGDNLSVRHAVASLRQSRGMSILTLDQLIETARDGGVATGKATVIVREGQPGASPVKIEGKVLPAPQGEQIRRWRSM